MAGKKKGGNTVAQVWDLAKPLAEELGLILWDVRFVKEGAQWYLRIFIDKEDGVGIDDCVAMSHAIDKPLDELDPISQPYCLEVCSPGIDRELTRPEHFEAFMGAPVRVRLIRPMEDGTREFLGLLLEYREDRSVVLALSEDESVTIEQKEYSSVRLSEEDMVVEEEQKSWRTRFLRLCTSWKRSEESRWILWWIKSAKRFRQPAKITTITKMWL